MIIDPNSHFVMYQKKNGSSFIQRTNYQNGKHAATATGAVLAAGDEKTTVYTSTSNESDHENESYT